MTTEGMDITFVVQGAISANTPSALASIRRHFPKSPIILSTWQGSDLSGVPAGVDVVLSDDPGAVFQDDTHRVMDNINRQIVSTVAGLRRVETSLAVKTRTDFEFTNRRITSQLEESLEVNLRNEPFFSASHQVFTQRLVVANYNVKNPKYSPLLFHPSDLVVAGRVDDLLLFFDVPLREPAESRYFVDQKDPRAVYPTLLSRYTAEAYLWVNCIRKANQLEFEHSYSFDDKLESQSNLYLVNNFDVFSPWQLGIKFSKYPLREFKSYASFTRKEFLCLRGSQIDNSLRVDLERWLYNCWQLGVVIKRQFKHVA